MLKIFHLTLTTANQNLWDLIVATGACDSLGNVLVTGTKNQAIIPDRGCNLDISSDTGNGTTTITISDRQGNAFNAFLPNTNFNKTSNRNSICLKDYQLKASVDGGVADVAMEYI